MTDTIDLYKEPYQTAAKIVATLESKDLINSYDHWTRLDLIVDLAEVVNGLYAAGDLPLSPDFQVGATGLVMNLTPISAVRRLAQVIEEDYTFDLDPEAYPVILACLPVETDDGTNGQDRENYTVED